MNGIPHMIIFPPDKAQKKLARLEKFMEAIENMCLLKLAQSRSLDDTTSFESFITEEGFSIEELEQLAESVEIE